MFRQKNVVIAEREIGRTGFFKALVLRTGITEIRFVSHHKRAMVAEKPAGPVMRSIVDDDQVIGMKRIFRQ